MTMVVNPDHRSQKAVVFDGRNGVSVAAEGVGRALRQAYPEPDGAKLPGDLKRYLDRLQ